MSEAIAQHHLELHLSRLLHLLKRRFPELEAPPEPLANLERKLSRVEIESTPPLESLKARFGLDEVEAEILLLAAAPALDLRWRRALEQTTRFSKLDVGFILSLLAREDEHPMGLLTRFDPASKLRKFGLVEVLSLGSADAAQLLSHRVQCPARVSHYLMGRTRLDETLSGLADFLPEATSARASKETLGICAQLKRWRSQRKDQLDHPALGVLIQGDTGLGKSQLTAELSALMEQPRLVLSCPLLGVLDPDRAVNAIRAAFDAARLWDSLLVLDQLESLTRAPALLAALAAQLDRTPVIVLSLCRTPIPESSGLTWRHLMELKLSLPESEEREEIWSRRLSEYNLGLDVEPGLLANQFPLNPAQINNALSHASLRVEGALSQEALAQASSDQLRADLSEFASSRTTRQTLDDLVLPPQELDSIREVISACRQRAAVLHRWGLGKRLDYGTGIVALFSGEPGTGKTLSARIIAEAVDMKLYQIAIPSIVSKWIGETERNISQIFHRARASKALLLFDEADSLLATRTEVKDATDRYANMSTNQLLQEIEAFEGVVILTTNKERNLDPAAERRILFRVNFPYPGVLERKSLWQILLPEAARDEGVDFDFLAESYELSGGHIKNVIMRAAYSAMERGQQMTTEILAEAADKESRAIGKLVRTEW